MSLRHIRVIRKSTLIRRVTEGGDPTTPLCTRCGGDVEPEVVLDVAHSITWVVKFCTHCGNRAVYRSWSHTQIPEPRHAADDVDNL